MSAYLSAHALYTDGDREVTWTEALDFHHQCGVVLSTPTVFVMARPVMMTWPDELHHTLTIAPSSADGWHVWAAAGDLPKMFEFAKEIGARQISFQRRDDARVRKYKMTHRGPQRGLRGGGRLN